LTTLGGREVKLAELKGRVVVLNFWFVGCAPCRAEIPDLNRLVDEYQGRDVVFLAVARDKAGMVREFLKEIPFKYGIVAEGVPTAEAFGVELYPTHILIDKAGNVAHVLSGGGADKYQELAPLIDALLKAEG